MIEFSNLIRITPITQSTTGSNRVYELIADAFSYIPQLTDSEAGNYWNCDKTIIIDLPNNEARRFFKIARKATLEIKSTDGRRYQIGTPDLPAMVQISSNLTSANLTIHCQMLTDPFL